VDPANADYYKARAADFEKRVLEATIGKELVGILTPAAAFNLLKTNQLEGFLAKTMLKGKPLSEQLGGWLKTGGVFRGKEMACYHKEWAYFSARFQVSCVTYIEAKPGIPPTPGHVEEVIALMKDRQIPVLFASNYFPKSQIDQVAAKTGARAVVVPENTFGAPGVTTYFDLVNTWVSGLAAGFGKQN
jgi:ABC-type Zn uptake system ZnuABC Zn-binding protein ZnuA